MRIVFVLSQSLESPSGLGRFGPIAREMHKLGHETEILALHHNWEHIGAHSFQDKGVNIRYVGQMHVRKVESQKIYYPPGKLITISLVGALQLARFLAISEADVIQLCKPQPINSLAVKLGGRGRQVYCDCDDYEAMSNRFQSEWQRRIVQSFEDNVINFADGLTVNTTFIRDRYVQLGFPTNQIIYVANGVEPVRFLRNPRSEQIRQKFGISRDDKVIIYIGTLSLLSHPIDLLLNAFQHVQKCEPLTKLLIVGGGEDYNLLIKMATNLGIERKTIFTGRVNPDEVADFLSVADLSVDPVKDDFIARARFPLKVVESLTMGIPVVTGDIGDRRNILEGGRFGVLTSPGDIDSLAEAILKIIQDSNLRKNIKVESIKSRERWYWNHIIHDYMKVFRTGE